MISAAPLQFLLLVVFGDEGAPPPCADGVAVVEQAVEDGR